MMKSTLVQVVAWCRQATSHYLGQCWSRSMLPYGITRPQWVKTYMLLHNQHPVTGTCVSNTWWRHGMEAFFTLLALCNRNPLVTSGFPTQRASPLVTSGFPTQRASPLVTSGFPSQRDSNVELSCFLHYQHKPLEQTVQSPMAWYTTRLMWNHSNDIPWKTCFNFYLL